MLMLCRSLMSGDRTGGFTIFYADDGLDTGPILLQRETIIELNDTVDTFYNRFLYPEGESGNSIQNILRLKSTYGLSFDTIIPIIHNNLYRNRRAFKYYVRHRITPSVNRFQHGIEENKSTVSNSEPLLRNDPIAIYLCLACSSGTVFAGVRSMGEAVRLIANKRAPKITQHEWGATYDPIWRKKALAEMDFSKEALAMHNFIRGNDKIPGAWCKVDGQTITLYGSKFMDSCRDQEKGTRFAVEGNADEAVVNRFVS